jgi:hypothetical protein
MCGAGHPFEAKVMVQEFADPRLIHRVHDLHFNGKFMIINP